MGSIDGPRNLALLVLERIGAGGTYIGEVILARDLSGRDDLQRTR